MTLKISVITSSARKTKKSIFAMLVASPAAPLNPKIAAMTATTRKIIAQVSNAIILVYLLWVGGVRWCY